MNRTQHPLDSWFNEKPRLRRAGLQAILIDEDWPEFLTRHRKWRSEDVILVRCLLQPTPEEIDAFLEEMVFDDDELSPALLKVWRQPMTRCLVGSQISSSNRRELFSFCCNIERGPGLSGFWGYGARHFSADWALFYCFGDEFNEYMSFQIRPIGFIDVSVPFRSAALLLNETSEFSGGFDSDDFGEATYITGRLDTAEIYRLLLATNGLGSDEVLNASIEELRSYRAPGTGCGFEAIEQIHK